MPDLEVNYIGVTTVLGDLYVIRGADRNISGGHVIRAIQNEIYMLSFQAENPYLC